MPYDLPAQFAEFGEARRNGFLKVKKVKEEGGRVAGIFCTFTPLEVLDAAGFTPVSLCGMSGETIPAAEAHLPKNLCPLIKSSYGFAVSDKCPYTYFSDLIVGETTCDGKKKMYELLNHIRPTYILHLPQGERENALGVWTAEIRRFKSFLEETFGVEITDAALREAAKARNEERAQRMRLMELQKQTPPPAKGYDLYKTLEGAGFIFETQQRIEQLRTLANDIQSAYARGERPVSANAKRILVTGCPIGGVLDKTVKIIEECGGAVVCFENCSGVKAAYQMVDTGAEDILTSIAARYLYIGCSVMTPNTVRMELLDKLIQEYAIDGVVEVTLQACTPYAVEAHFIRREMERLGVPYMSIETDYAQSDSGQLSTRLEAFLEMLQ
ncbi:MAG: double-cubane-cluster-containing anaerobic reductase [Clostridia bacterium]|nr:double-cubane-cluster-containing anaerobic reductase [Clostridia bacterium]